MPELKCTAAENQPQKLHSPWTLFWVFDLQREGLTWLWTDISQMESEHNFVFHFTRNTIKGAEFDDLDYCYLVLLR